MIPMYNTFKFTDIYEDVEDFMKDYKNQNEDFKNQIPQKVSDANMTTLFYLLYAKYGNNPIANYDVTQFKYKLFATVFQYGPTWEKRLDIQDKLRNLTESQMMQGAKSILNTALNPDQEPTVEEISYVNSQNTTKQTKSVLGAYAELWTLLRSDVTTDFLNQFRKLFKVVVIPDREFIYITENEEEEE